MADNHYKYEVVSSIADGEIVIQYVLLRYAIERCKKNPNTFVRDIETGLTIYPIEEKEVVEQPSITEELTSEENIQEEKRTPDETVEIAPEEKEVVSECPVEESETEEIEKKEEELEKTPLPKVEVVKKLSFFEKIKNIFKK